MVWLIEFDDSAKKDLKKLDVSVAKRITRFLRDRISVLGDPRQVGAALSGRKYGDYWKYRVGDYRIICDIQDQVVRMLVVKVGRRSDIYD